MPFNYFAIVEKYNRILLSAYKRGDGKGREGKEGNGSMGYYYYSSIVI